MQVGGAGKTPRKEPDAPALRPQLQTGLMNTTEAMPVPIGLGLTIHPDAETKAAGDPTFLQNPGGRASPVTQPARDGAQALHLNTHPHLHPPDEG